MKKITVSDIIGSKGIALVARRVADMGFLWHPTGGVEAGTDGFIEVRDPGTGEVLASVLKVQSKATEGGGRWQRITKDSFEFACKESDIAYWLSGNVPVILVCSDVETDEACWKLVSEYFRDPKTRKSRRVVFDRERDRFDAAAAVALMNLAVPKRAGLYLPPPMRSEELVSNLLEVKSFAQSIYVAPAQCPSMHALHEELSRHGAGHECFMRGGNVISFQPLDGPPWTRVCDTGAAEEFGSDEWAESDDPATQREFVELLNRALSARISKDIAFNRKRGMYYFKSPDDLSDVKLGRRRVFGEYRTKDGERVKFYRHSAFRGRFASFDGRWYLEITPEYLFTRDGRQVSRFQPEYVKGVKGLEKNDAVRQQIETVARYLTQPPTLLEPAYGLLEFGDLVRFTVDFGFDDTAWGSSHAEAETTSSLFEDAA
jgi:hypothetical protein